MKGRNSDGFILLEVMLALVVLTGGSMVIFQSYRNSLHMVGQSKEFYKQALAVEGRIGELEMTGHAEEAKALLEQRLHTH